MWTEEQVEKLRQMWEQGKTSNEIAKKLGVTKNSIVGKVHRLCLKARPSPIKSKEDKSENLTQQENYAAEETISANAMTEEKFVENEKAQSSAKNGKKVTRCIKLTDLDSHTCRWPIGDPRDDDFCFCGRKVRAGQTYCDEHSQVAYVNALRK